MNEIAREVEIDRQPFTGTVDGDSVRLQIGSATLGTRYIGRLDGDTLELALPQPGGELRNTRLRSASRSDFDGELRRSRVVEKRRADTTRQRRSAADRQARTAIASVATAFQRALNPDRRDDPCKYMTREARQGFLNNAGPDRAGDSCRAIAHAYAREWGAYTPRGTPKITLREYIVDGLDDKAHNGGAQVRWPALRRPTLYVDLIKQDGQWRVIGYRS